MRDSSGKHRAATCHIPWTGLIVLKEPEAPDGADAGADMGLDMKGEKVTAGDSAITPVQSRSAEGDGAEALAVSVELLHQMSEGYCRIGSLKCTFH